MTNSRSKRLIISQRAETKSLILQKHTTNEWSGYGPVVEDGDDIRLLDFYYLSHDDSGASSNLDAQATAEAWTRVIADGYDGVKSLAWVHCHPNGMPAFWSGTDESAILDCLKYGATKQVSVLFTRKTTIARIDSKAGRQDMVVLTEYGSYEEDVEKAKESEQDESIICHGCDSPAITIECEACGFKYCQKCLSVVTKDQVLCKECFAPVVLDCPDCLAEETVHCIYCDESVCEAHKVTVDTSSGEQVLCRLCWEALYDDEIALC